MLYAVLISAAAGLCTGLGGFFVLFGKRPAQRGMAFSLGFAAGVMLTVSLADMLPHAISIYSDCFGEMRSAIYAVSLCACGMVCAWLLGKCIPEPSVDSPQSAAQRSAIVVAAAVVLHNMPEGVLTLFTGYANPALGLSFTLAVAMHNIPEGIAVAVPVYYANGSRSKAFFAALLSGLAEPLGAVLAFAFLRDALTPLFLNGMIAFIAGIMLWVSYSELAKQSFSFDKPLLSSLGLSIGTAVMYVGICLL